MCDSSFGEVMSPSDTLNSVDQRNVRLVEHKVVNEFLRGSLYSIMNLTGSGPLSVNSHGMSTSDGEASRKDKEILGSGDADKALNSGERASSNENPVSSFHISYACSNFLSIFLNHNSRLFTEAATTTAIMTFIIDSVVSGVVNDLLSDWRCSRLLSVFISEFS